MRNGFDVNLQLPTTLAYHKTAIELIYASILSTNLLDNFLFNFKLKSFHLWQNPLI